MANQDAPTTTPMQDVVIEKVAAFSDVDLRAELATRDYSCGPIVGTTRSVYRKKLVDLILAADYPSEGLNATHSDPSKPSEDEEEEEPPKVKLVRDQNGGKELVKPDVDEAIGGEEEEEEEEEKEEEDLSQEDLSQEDLSQEEDESDSPFDSQEDEGLSEPATLEPVSASDLRQRIPHIDPRIEPRVESTQSSVSYVSEDGRTVKRTTTTTTRVVKKSDLESSARPAPVAASPAPDTEKPKRSSCLSLFLQLLVILIIAVFVYIIVTGSSSRLALPEAPHDVENPPMGHDDV